MSLSRRVDLEALRRGRPFAHYFRYPLHHRDFMPLRIDRRLRGYFAAKPLYGRLTASGRVDRSAGFNGEIAVIFIPSPARSSRHARLLKTHMPPSRVTRDDGRRNWPAIRAAAQHAVTEMLTG